MKKRVLAGVIGTTLLMGLGTGALAASSLEEIKAYLNGEIKFKVNGADWRPSDEKGNEMMPITYNGNTYVPLRSVSTALNTPIDYDGESKTVVLGEKVDGISLLSKDIKYTRTVKADAEDLMDKDQLILNGKQYNGAYRLDLITDSGDFRITSLDLGKSYSKMNAVIGIKGNGAKVKVTGDKDQILKEFELGKDEVKEIQIDLQNTQKPKFYVSSKGKGSFYLFKETTVK
ncbi:stalk domain-containing protein [Paenibacillus sp. FSL H8-0034]|uniref:stalk domain-containing protein n=1 Tax=Paenibacillus sp. FSL H8-0034 TaxID=2954671 RepID=UPI0030F940D7